MRIGLLPDQFWDMTLCEFLYYQKGYEFRLARQWDMTASFMALFANANSAKGKRFSPNDFHPLMDVSSPSRSRVTTAEERDALFAQLKEF